ncbi:sugar phosphate isomerase/epimerase [Mycobacterium sp. URHB0044]|uniref:sugar phosphate isomerase/epimerase family protein n=1 Tax=Mycobacterium sp. URHB0044 TaxID=1380386 RepID=UPI0005623621|nr:sugar phosphate isomerase/epimerase [Mycobacterium sp. URHB0044]
MTRPIGLAHLSALHLSPPELVEVAASCGYASVGVRVHPATPSEARYPMTAGSPMAAQTVARLADVGLAVFDVEVFTLDGTRGREQWLPVLEAGAFLGASVLNVIGGDEQRNRLIDNLSGLVRDAREFGIMPLIEPISYQKVDTFAAAVSVAARTGCGIMLDVLHFVRAGGTANDLEAAPEGMVQLIQLCDGPAEVPHLAAPARMPLGQDTDGSARQIESRARRLVPGAGDFPLDAILAKLPGVPISIEVPDVVFVETFGVARHLARLMTSTRNLLATERRNVLQ